MATLSGRPEEGVRWTRPDGWHVTLRFLGDADVGEATEAFRSMADAPGLGPVDAEMGPSTGRFGPRVLHVPVAGLEPLTAAAVVATGGVGRPPDARGFSGHLTLGRAKARAGTNLTPWSGLPLAARWPVDEVTLVASHPGRDGPRYEVVDRLSLVGPDAVGGDAGDRG
ncbi:MAG: 2'-5' RNA ligase family protein [Acidimicrobiales bacterium]